jgi:hypothetical protein
VGIKTKDLLVIVAMMMKMQQRFVGKGKSDSEVKVLFSEKGESNGMIA